MYCTLRFFLKKKMTVDLKYAGWFTIIWPLLAMFENLTMSLSHMDCIFGSSQGVMEGQNIDQTAQSSA